MVLLFFSLLACLAAGCERLPTEYRTFLEMPPARQHEVMRELPPDKQLDYYLAGMRYVHPPQSGLADDIASQGKQALPFLMKRLREEKDELTQLDIMYVFEEMHTSYYNLKDEKEVISLLKETAAKMKDPRWKSSAEERVTYITENRVPDVETVLQQ